MKKLIFIITSSEIGGAQVWVRDQVKLLSREFDIKVVTNKSGWLSDSLSPGLCHFIPEMESRVSLTALIRVTKFLKKEGAQIVVANSANAGLYGRLSSLFVGCRSVYVSHGWSCLYNGGGFKRVFVFVEWALSLITDLVLCISSNDRIDAIKKIKISESKLVVIKNGVYPAKNRKSHGPSSKLQVLFVGRLISPKRVDLLIEAIQGNDDVVLTVVGAGPLAAQLPKRENVIQLGEIPGFSDFHKYDIFSLISDSEGLPMSAIEAASSCVPLLLSSVGGCAEVISDEAPNGILVSNDVDDIKNAIQCLQSDYADYYQNAVIFSKSVDVRSKVDRYVNAYNGEDG